MIPQGLEADKIICNIIQNELGLSDGRIVVKDQNFEPPKDSGLYVIVSFRNSKVASSTNEYNPVDDTEIKRTVMYHSIDIDITSKNRDAITRKEEVVMSLTSYYAENLMSQEQCKIFRHSPLLDLSFVENSRALNRYRINVIVCQVKEKIIPIPVFDKFTDITQLIEQ